MTSNKRQAALDYATIYGWPVFPCLPNAKEPAVAGGFRAATTDPDQINAWWDQNEDFNIGIRLDAIGLVVIDLDTYKPGFIEPNFPETYAVTSPRGGNHLYYRGHLRSSHGDILGRGIDTRGTGGYVLLPPSTIGGKPYAVLHDRPIAPLPSWIAERMERAVPAVAAVADLDLPSAIARATEYLKRAAPAISGHDGNNTTFKLAADLFDLGVSLDTARELAAGWNDRCEPPWAPEELAQVFENAWRYKHDPPGIEAVASAAETFPGYVSQTSETERVVRPLTIAEMRERARQERNPEYLWKGRLLRYEPNLWTGDAGIGKTTLIENIAVAVAEGNGLLGQPTLQTSVLLFVAEDRYKAVLRNLQQIAAARSISLDEIDIKVLSTDSEDIPHIMAEISEDGHVATTTFFSAVVVPALEANRGALLVLDPLAEFVSFDHNNDKAARACARDFLVALARDYEVTPVVTDHPSRAGLASGEHYGGSKEMKAAFPSVATLRWTDPKEKMTGNRHNLTFEVLRSRYAPPSETNFYRLGDDPAYKLDPAQGMTPDEIDKIVLTHVLSRWNNDPRLTTGKTASIYGPEQAAEAVGISTKLWERSVTRLSDHGLLTYISNPGRHPPTWAPGPKLEMDPK